jgi:hypothetical protein
MNTEPKKARMKTLAAMALICSLPGFIGACGGDSKDCSIEEYEGIGGRPCGDCYPDCPAGYSCFVGAGFAAWEGDVGICYEQGRDTCHLYSGNQCDDPGTSCLQQTSGGVTDQPGICVTPAEREAILSGPAASNFTW